MALGDLTYLGDGDTACVELLASTTATNSPPATAGAGIDCNLLRAFGQMPSRIGIQLVSTAGSGTMSCSAKLWSRVNAVWTPVGAGADATKGMLNAAVSIGETEADKLQHFEPLDMPGFCQRLYLEITAIAGTSTAVKAFLVWRRGS